MNKRREINNEVSTLYQQQKDQKLKLNRAKIKVVKQYMGYFDELIKTTIKKDNETIYNGLQEFVQTQCAKLTSTGNGSAYGSIREAI